MSFYRRRSRRQLGRRSRDNLSHYLMTRDQTRLQRSELSFDNVKVRSANSTRENTQQYLPWIGSE